MELQRINQLAADFGYQRDSAFDLRGFARALLLEASDAKATLHSGAQEGEKESLRIEQTSAMRAMSNAIHDNRERFSVESVSRAFAELSPVMSGEPSFALSVSDWESVPITALQSVAKMIAERYTAASDDFFVSFGYWKATDFFGCSLQEFAPVLRRSLSDWRNYAESDWLEEESIRALLRRTKDEISLFRALRK